MKMRADTTQGVVGFFAVILTSVLLAAGYGLKGLAVRLGADAKAYAIITGLLLLVVLLVQWRLFFFRRSKEAQLARAELGRHRWYGVLFVVLLLAHGGSFGVGLASFLAGAVIIVSVAGLLFKPIFRKSPFVWRWVHIGVSAILLSLVILHAWAGLVFQGPVGVKMFGQMSPN